MTPSTEFFSDVDITLQSAPEYKYEKVISRRQMLSSSCGWLSFTYSLIWASPSLSFVAYTRVVLPGTLLDPVISVMKSTGGRFGWSIKLLDKTLGTKLHTWFLGNFCVIHYNTTPMAIFMHYMFHVLRSYIR